MLFDDLEKKPTQWDAKLIKGLYMMEAFEVEGHPIWIEESPDIEFKAVPRDIRSLEAIEKKQEAESKKKNPRKGRRFIAIAKLKNSESKWPTRAAWIEANRKKREGKPSEVSEKKIIDRDNAAEERAKQKRREMGYTVD